MPFAYGALGIHDDLNHTGSAKRDTNSGVAGLDASGNLLVKGSTALLTRDGTNTIFVNERTSAENAMKLLRNGVNDYAAYVREGGAVNRVQTAAMKDVASGIVAQDASGNATVTGSRALLTRDGSNDVGLTERTSNEAMLQIKRLGANSYQARITIGGGVQYLVPLDTNYDIPHMRPKAASANLRHSHDAQVNTTSNTYVLLKTITFANGISGTLRIAWRMWNLNGSPNPVAAKARKTAGGVTSDLGAEQTATSSGATPEQKTQDIAVGVLAPGDTIELWGHQNPFPEQMFADQFRVSYDNAADTVLVAGATNS